jgi:hypothetical protein
MSDRDATAPSAHNIGHFLARFMEASTNSAIMNEKAGLPPRNTNHAVDRIARGTAIARWYGDCSKEVSATFTK